MTRPLTALAALAAIAALAAMTAPTALAASATEALPSQRRVLLLGNSLTYENELPRMVEWISRRGGERPMLVVEEIAVLNAALEDHWRDGRALVRPRSKRSARANSPMWRRWRSPSADGVGDGRAVPSPRRRLSGA